VLTQAAAHVFVFSHASIVSGSESSHWELFSHSGTQLTQEAPHVPGFAHSSTVTGSLSSQSALDEQTAEHCVFEHSAEHVFGFSHTS
jgi:hypothetical protein